MAESEEIALGLEMDSAIKAALKLDVDRVKVSEELSHYMEKLITNSDDPVSTLDQFLCRMHQLTTNYPEEFTTPEGSIAMSMEATSMRAILLLWYRCPDIKMKHIRQSLGMIPMAIGKETHHSVMHSTRGIPDWWPEYQQLLLKETYQCLTTTSRKRIDTSFGYRMIYLTCFLVDRVSPMNIGNYCPEEAKLLEILITTIGLLQQKTQLDDQYLSDVIGRSLPANRPVNYCQTLANAAFFLNSMARMVIKEKILIALRDQSDNKPHGLHAKKFALLNLSKLLIEYTPYAPTMKEIIQLIVKLCPRLELAYKLLRGQNYTESNYDCLPTCLDLAFPTVVDDPEDHRYVCEFDYLRDVLRYIGLKQKSLLQELLDSVEPKQARLLQTYDNHWRSFPDRKKCKFQCVNHRFQDEDSNICPILKRECLNKRSQESFYA